MEQPTREKIRHPAPPRHAALVRVWRWYLAASSEAIPLTWARPLADAVYAALTEVSWMSRGSRRLPVCLHGPRDAKTIGWRHDHAFILPEDANGDGLIDHVSVSAAMGLDPAAVRLLAATDRLVLSNGAIVELVLQCAAGLDAAGHVGPAHIWLSHTAYVPPNARPSFHPKNAARQLRSEIAKRALPAPLVATPVFVPQLGNGDDTLTPQHFYLESDAGETPPQGSQPCFFRLEFEQPVPGPLAFGWDCHRGLGQFAPVE
jgi:CRISPR-associated protein Csb2